ncbi:MAG: GNAT family protein [Nocardioides sp.]
MDPDLDLDLATELRSVVDADAALLQRWREAATSCFDDFNAKGPESERDQSLPLPGDMTTMLVLDRDRQPIGTVQWHPVRYGPTRGSVALNIGISLQADARGQGHGTRAQALLSTYLFDRYPVNRVEAGTDIENIAEQRALLGAGFHRDGVLRGAQWRAGAWHDLVMYSRLRND